VTFAADPLDVATAEENSGVLASLGFALSALGPATLAVRGVLMAPLPLAVVAGIFAAAVVFAFALDEVKVQVFRRLRMG